MVTVLTRTKGEWKCVLAGGGEVCVMTHGTTMMLPLYVDNLVLEH